MQKREIKLEVRVTKAVYDKLKALAEEDESTCSAVVRKAIKRLLESADEK